MSAVMRLLSSGGSFWKTSGFSTSPSRTGASAKPIGVRRRAILLLLGVALEGAECLFLAVLELLLDDFAARAIILALEGGGEGHAQLADQPLHREAQRDRAAGRQLDAAGPVRIGEVVDIAPVGRRGLLCCLGGKHLAHQGVPAGPRRAEGEDVEALVPHGDAEAEGIDRPFLADQPVECGEFVGGGEFQLVRRAAASQEWSRQCLPRKPFGLGGRRL